MPWEQADFTGFPLLNFKTLQSGGASPAFFYLLSDIKIWASLISCSPWCYRSIFWALCLLCLGPWFQSTFRCSMISHILDVNWCSSGFCRPFALLCFSIYRLRQGYNRKLQAFYGQQIGHVSKHVLMENLTVQGGVKRPLFISLPASR